MGLNGTIRSHPLVFLFGLAAVSLLGLLFVPPIPQSQIYHGFADQRTLLGIPNFWNVVSNLPFILGRRAGPAIFSPRPVGRPVFPRRVPDRLQLVLLPLESERRRPVLGSPADVDRVHGDPGECHRGADRREGGQGCCSGRWSLLGIVSLLVWLRTDDLRLYAWVQFFPCLVLPLMFWLFAPKYSGTWYWFAAAGWYLLAKVLEYTDAAIYSARARHGRPRAQASSRRPAPATRSCALSRRAAGRVRSAGSSRRTVEARSYFSSTKIEMSNLSSGVVTGSV